MKNYPRNQKLSNFSEVWGGGGKALLKLSIGKGANVLKYGKQVLSANLWFPQRGRADKCFV
jgi:hypothetical protein